MLVTIQNMTGQRVLLRFNSGLTRHLAPRETLQRVEHVEIKDNARIKHLEERHIVVMRAVQEKPCSKDMKATEALEYIENTRLEELQDFLSPDEDRVTVLRAMQAKRGLYPRSADLSAEEAIRHIEGTPLGRLTHFLSEGEGRVTVLEAWRAKQRS